MVSGAIMFCFNRMGILGTVLSTLEILCNVHAQYCLEKAGECTTAFRTLAGQEYTTYTPPIATPAFCVISGPSSLLYNNRRAVTLSAPTSTSKLYAFFMIKYHVYVLMVFLTI